MAPRLGLGNSVTANPASGLFGANLFLDNFPNAHGAYSLRKLSSTYTGACFVIRRTVDNVEANLHFDTSNTISFDSVVDNFSSSSSATNLGQFMAASGYADADSLGSVASARIDSWKDQSGNGRDIATDIADKQPLLVHNGVIITENSKVALDFDEDRLVNEDSSSYAQPTTYVIVVQSDATSGNDYILDTDSGGGGRQLVVHSGNKKTLYSSTFAGSTEASDNDQNLWFTVFDGSSSVLHINGGSNVLTGSPGTGAQSGLTVGGRKSGTNYWNGRIQEIIYYTSDQSGSRSEIELDANSYYSIY